MFATPLPSWPHEIAYRLSGPLGQLAGHKSDAPVLVQPEAVLLAFRPVNEVDEVLTLHQGKEAGVS